MKHPKAKGRRLQNKVVELILQHDNLLTEYDVKPAVMGETGMDIKLSTIARERFPFAVEAKNTERLNIWKALEQAEANSEDLIPMLVFKRNHSKIYATIELEKLLELLWK